MSDTTTQDAVTEIEAMLTAQLEAERSNNAKSLKYSAVAAGGVGLYLLWISSAIGTFVDPEGLALAAAGFAVDAVPAAAAQIRSVVVDGAPDLARAGSEQMIEQIPNYREALQQEIDPVIDQVCGVLADAAVTKMAEQAGDPKAVYSDDAALDHAAEAAIGSLDAVLAEAMDEKDEDGVSPRATIESSLSQLKHIDTELQRVTKKGGNPAERELLLAWLNVLGQTPAMKIEKDTEPKPGSRAN
jgi:hypothetical protein